MLLHLAYDGVDLALVTALEGSKMCTKHAIEQLVGKPQNDPAIEFGKEIHEGTSSNHDKSYASSDQQTHGAPETHMHHMHRTKPPPSLDLAPNSAVGVHMGPPEQAQQPPSWWP